MKIEFVNGVLHAIPESVSDLKKIIESLRNNRNKEVISFGISKKSRRVGVRRCGNCRMAGHRIERCPAKQV